MSKRFEEEVILRAVDEIRADEPRVGTRKLQDRLQKTGHEVGRDRLFKLLGKSGDWQY